MSLNLNSPPPYSAPVVQLRYLPTATRARVVIVLLIIGAATSALSMLLAIVELATPGDLLGADEDMSNPITLVFALFTLAVGLLTIFIYIATVITFLMWLYRAHQNLGAFGVAPHQLHYSSGWAVGSFFIPFASLVIPYRAIKELWRKSMPDASAMFSDLNAPAFFPLWWGLWIASNITDQLYFRLTMQESVSADTAATISVVSGILGILAAFFAIKVVREIELRQSESRKRVPSLAAFPQPPAPPQFAPPSGTAPA